MPQAFIQLFTKVRHFLMKPEGAIPAIIGLFHFWLMLRMTDGNLFNSYPFISDDGFDWITQGLAFNQLITGQDATEWPILRSPVFVMLSAIDQVLGSRGFVIILTQALAVASISSLVIGFARKHGFGLIASLLVGIAVYLSISSYFHLWILSDSLASCIMAFSAVAAIQRLNAYEAADAPNLPKQSTLVAPIALAIAAGLTQTYGLIPILVIGGIYTAGSIVRLQSSRVLKPAIIMMVTASVFVFGGKALWAAMIPHGQQPAQFSLLKFDLSMMDFYIHVWPLFFGVFLPTAITAVYFRIKGRQLYSFELLSLLGVCCSFAALSVLYHWADARFTFIYFPIAWLALISLCSLRAHTDGNEAATSSILPFRHGVLNTALAGTALSAISIGLFFAPSNFWEPKLENTRVSFNDSWIMQALDELPRDRYNLASMCGSRTNICEAAAYDTPWSKYTIIIFAEYKRRNTEWAEEPAAITPPDTNSL